MSLLPFPLSCPTGAAAANSMAGPLHALCLSRAGASRLAVRRARSGRGRTRSPTLQPAICSKPPPLSGTRHDTRSATIGMLAQQALFAAQRPSAAGSASAPQAVLFRPRVRRVQASAGEHILFHRHVVGATKPSLSHQSDKVFLHFPVYRCQAGCLGFRPAAVGRGTQGESAPCLNLRTRASAKRPANVPFGGKIGRSLASPWRATSTARACSSSA